MEFFTLTEAEQEEFDRLTSGFEVPEERILDMDGRPRAYSG